MVLFSCFFQQKKEIVKKKTKTFKKPLLFLHFGGIL